MDFTNIFHFVSFISFTKNLSFIHKLLFGELDKSKTKECKLNMYMYIQGKNGRENQQIVATNKQTSKYCVESVEKEKCVTRSSSAEQTVKQCIKLTFSYI